MQKTFKIKGLEKPLVASAGLKRRESLAFLRGYLEGMELGKLDQLYPDQGAFGGKPLSPERRLAAIRHDLARFAEEDGRPLKEARLLWIDPERLKAPAKVIPMSLEEFQWERDPDGFYTEAELLEIYKDEVAVPRVDDRRRIRNERIRRRQVDALRKIEQLMPSQPSREDSLSKWMPAMLVEQMELVHLRTVGELSDYISRVGHAWWRLIKKVGPRRARAIEQWLVSLPVEEGPIEIWPVPLHVERTSGVNVIAPWESLLVPEWMQGDFNRLQQWFAEAEYRVAANTFRVYRRSMERYVLFCMFEISPGSSLFDEEVLVKFEDFLSLLGRTEIEKWGYEVKQTDWIGPRHAERMSKAWRPFAGPPGNCGVRLTIDAVASVLGKCANGH